MKEVFPLCNDETMSFLGHFYTSDFGPLKVHTVMPDEIFFLSTEHPVLTSPGRPDKG